MLSVKKTFSGIISLSIFQCSECVRTLSVRILWGSSPSVLCSIQHFFSKMLWVANSLRIISWCVFECWQFLRRVFIRNERGQYVYPVLTWYFSCHTSYMPLDRSELTVSCTDSRLSQRDSADVKCVECDWLNSVQRDCHRTTAWFTARCPLKSLSQTRSTQITFLFGQLWQWVCSQTLNHNINYIAFCSTQTSSRLRPTQDEMHCCFDNTKCTYLRPTQH